MARVGLTQAAKLTGKAASTITRRSNHRDPKKRLSFTRNEDGEKVYDVAELERVFGRLHSPDQDSTISNDASARTNANASPSNDLQQELEAALEAHNTQLQEHVVLLQTQLAATRKDLEEWREMAKLSTRMLEDHRSQESDVAAQENQQDRGNAPTVESEPTQNSPRKTIGTSNWFARWLGRGR